ncbi:Prolyl-tRNA editing protein ProX [Anatilimnocola aggregata]|uniref:Prolyl-tRNA editing protein ProX n=1 Tax=Anatilimnocola aggregata TaxID=2528021 RepID=A0A517YIJ1_9BACT|nr:YbaK/EbsC family protein [Anatilimnocola aggregata]QDU30050.1 Prolyl-tRNA editing protein ProX [Anatilimnocola aggregata]
MADSVFVRLCALLDARQLPYEVLHHAPVFTSEEAAAIRGTTLASGAKALICKVDEQFVLIVLPADRKLASKLAKKALGGKSLRFATKEEVLQLTGLTPGSIPPFGSLFQLPTWCDEQLAQQPQLNFNAGDHAISLKLTYETFVQAEQPRLAALAE